MLKEESYHWEQPQRAAAHHQGGPLPTGIMQRYFNKWVSTAFDLFGTDHSSSAHWATCGASRVGSTSGAIRIRRTWAT